MRKGLLLCKNGNAYLANQQVNPDGTVVYFRMNGSIELQTPLRLYNVKTKFYNPKPGGNKNVKKSS